jgi:hypothetical protein
MPMDPQLAALYGTDEETDTEKMAAAEMAEGLAEEEQFDVATATDEQVEALAQEFLASEGEQTEETAEVAEGTEEEQVKVSADEEAQEKLAEADYLGRVMAHAYVQELRGIESEEKTAGVKDSLKAGAGKARAAIGRVGELLAGGQKPLAGGRRPGNFAKIHPKGSKYRSEQAKSMGARAGAAAVAGAGAAAVRHHKKKQSSAETEELSALDVLAERRAMEILEANGIELEAPEAVETEKTSASEEEMNLLAQAVEARAEELLAANGYEFEQEQVEEQAQE